MKNANVTKTYELMQKMMEYIQSHPEKEDEIIEKFQGFVDVATNKSEVKKEFEEKTQLKEMDNQKEPTIIIDELQKVKENIVSVESKNSEKETDKDIQLGAKDGLITSEEEKYFLPVDFFAFIYSQNERGANYSSRTINDGFRKNYLYKYFGQDIVFGGESRNETTYIKLVNNTNYIVFGPKQIRRISKNSNDGDDRGVHDGHFLAFCLSDDQLSDINFDEDTILKMENGEDFWEYTERKNGRVGNMRVMLPMKKNNIRKVSENDKKLFEIYRLIKNHSEGEHTQILNKGEKCSVKDMAYLYQLSNKMPVFRQKDDRSDTYNCITPGIFRYDNNDTEKGICVAPYSKEEYPYLSVTTFDIKDGFFSRENFRVILKKILQSKDLILTANLNNLEIFNKKIALLKEYFGVNKDKYDKEVASLKEGLNWYKRVNMILTNVYQLIESSEIKLDLSSEEEQKLSYAYNNSIYVLNEWQEYLRFVEDNKFGHSSSSR